jgi:hypothetical protein
LATVQDENVILIATADIYKNYFDLEFEGLLPTWSGEFHAPNYLIICLIVLQDQSKVKHGSHMPNDNRKLAGGHPLYVSFVDTFDDDVSGNRTKSWNKHWNCYLTHRNLPQKLLNQEFHVHFISTSPHASTSEQFSAFKKIIESVSKTSTF